LRRVALKSPHPLRDPVSRVGGRQRTSIFYEKGKKEEGRGKKRRRKK